ncbi:Y-family DNA polymerase [Proteus mirabilis]|uniref:Y-family DNA polymerase n=2 Tax=Proteus mirabilis TaxID=584 RepID=UPI00295304CF|nr:hypothetical protein [Proteus mirabilis]
MRSSKKKNEYYIDFLFHINADISNRVMDTLSGFAPRVETYSIDEQFLDMTGMLRNFPLEDYGRKIQQRILQIAHVPVGVGFAQTKTLALYGDQLFL